MVLDLGGKVNKALSYLMAKDASDKLTAVANNNNNDCKCFSVLPLNKAVS